MFSENMYLWFEWECGQMLMKILDFSFRLHLSWSWVTYVNKCGTGSDHYGLYKYFYQDAFINTPGEFLNH